MAAHKPSKPRVRILIGAATALGPGKVDLLEAISKTGSISAAARAMGMSYRRAWQLVDSMNKGFKEELVRTATGGRGGGGAEITGRGYDVLARFRDMEAKAAASVDAEVTAFAKLLADPEADT